MKTILDKIDPKYLECSTGACEHAIHATNGVMWFVVVALLLTLSKYYYVTKNNDSV